MKRVFFVLILIVLFSHLSSAALGISPAGKRYDFVPNQVIKVDYTVITDDPLKEIEIYLDGDLAQYAVASKNYTVGSTIFTVTLTLPNYIDKPGQNTLAVVAREIPSDDQFLGTAITIGVLLKVFVPYPGRYIEASLNIPDGNIDELIPAEVSVTNRGVEDLNVSIELDIFSKDGQHKEKIIFQNEFIETTQNKLFRKLINSSNYRPGDYYGVANINYGNSLSINDSFRLGSLFVNLTDYTREVKKGGIQRYTLDIQSRWNGALREVFADVNVSNGKEEEIFRTPSIELIAWSDGELVGFLDTTDLSGKYDVNITLNYNGVKTNFSADLKIKDAKIVLIIVSVLIVILILGLIVFIASKKRRSKSKR